MAAVVTLPEQVVSMSGQAADKLVALGQGDSALLYVALLRYGGDLPQALAALRWSQGRLDAAYAGLREAGLVGPAPAKEEEAVPRDVRPEYMTKDVTAALSEDKAFSILVEQTEKRLGVLLSTADLKQLMWIYDYLALPAEVILLLEGWCIGQMEEKYGPGRRPRLSQIKKEACRWREMGVDTLAAAEEFLRRQKGLSQRERVIFPQIGVRDRPPLDKEREYVAAWVDWGFSDEAIVMAYQRTLLKKQAMSWPYMNSILKSWHAKGLHTPKEISAGDDRRSAAPVSGGKKPAVSPVDGQRVAQDLADLRKAAHQGG